MNERDEQGPPYLVGVTDDFPGGNDDDLTEWAFERGIEYQKWHSKPRQVTTVEELDALPVDSVVMESEQDTFIIRTMRGVFHRFPDGWYVVAGHGARTNIELPATVLHVGGAE